MDLVRKALFFTMDVIAGLAFANPFGNLKNDQDMYKRIQSTGEMLLVMIVMTSIPALSAFFQIGWVGKLLFPNDNNTTGVGKLIGYALHCFRGLRVKMEYDLMNFLASQGSRFMIAM
jgi:hypothetical protein